MIAAQAVDTVWLFILAVVALILGAIAVFTSRPGWSLTALGLCGISLAGALYWWP